MNVSLTPKLEQLITAKVATGLYTSNSEVVREALRLLEERDRLRELRLADLRSEIAVGIEQADRGEYTEYDEHTLKRRLREIMNQQHAKTVDVPNERP